MRMIPAEQIEMLVGGGLFCEAHVVGRELETITRRVVSPIRERKQIFDFAGSLAVAAKQRTAALVGISLDAVRVNLLQQSFSDF